MSSKIFTTTLGRHVASVFRKNYYGEYRVRFYIDGNFSSDQDYYTDDKEDAIRTAKAVIQRQALIHMDAPTGGVYC